MSTAAAVKKVVVPEQQTNLPAVHRHADPPRGLEMPLPVGGLFGRMFPLSKKKKIVPAKFKESALAKLADAMSADLEEDIRGEKARESGIPALYTYFGQFLGHDLTFDPSTSFQKEKDKQARVDFRTPALDLDSVYGRGPADQPYMYVRPSLQDSGADNFLPGEPLNSGHFGAVDLPRNSANPARALIADPRNDENIIVSQLHALFLRFHNRLAEKRLWTFERVHREVTFHYQHIVLHHFLPLVIHSSVLKKYKSGKKYDKHKIRFYRPWETDPKARGLARRYPFLPIEFSVAAYRFGHSMVRPIYQLNDEISAAIFPVGDVVPSFLTGFQPINPKFGLDWGRFVDTETRSYGGPKPEPGSKRLQFAFQIDTVLANPLSNLPLSVAPNLPRSLAERNLRRGNELELPSGQTLARAMRIEKGDILKDEEIYIGSPVGGQRRSIVDIDPSFKEKGCPLWTYILAEAMHYKEKERLPVTGKKRFNVTWKLGPVGGRIVAEVILGLMFADPESLLNDKTGWKPKAFSPDRTANDYTLPDFVRFAQMFLGDKMSLKTTRSLLSVLFGAAALCAQGPPPGPGFGGPGAGPGGPGFGPGAPVGPTVTGSPYSAVQTFQSQQTLANGNEIQRNDQGKVYRDSQGRVRTETTMTPPSGSTAQARTSITIVDPVAGYVTRLDPQSSTAVKTALPSGTPPARPAPPSGSTAPQVQTEDLGSKTINGLVATGTRTLITIPAGAAGNTQAIQSVREVWISQDLQVPVLITNSDPRFGTSTSQLSIVTRAEPDASLFQVPSTYTVSTRARPAGRGPVQ